VCKENESCIEMWGAGADFLAFDTHSYDFIQDLHL